jgi:hypothetical protein
LTTNTTKTRCSHPLCNTQHTTTPQPTTTTTTPDPPTKRAPQRRALHKVTDALDGPGQKQPKNTPTGVSSGPNSVPNPTPHRDQRLSEKSVLRSTPPHTRPEPTGTGPNTRREATEKRSTPTPPGRDRPAASDMPSSPHGKAP